jgi:acyl transferase domain-containing protein
LREHPELAPADVAATLALRRAQLEQRVAVVGSDRETLLAGLTRLAADEPLSPRTHPWLADHTISGTVLMPGTGFVELALVVGARIGVPRLAELTLTEPLMLPADGAADLQLTVGQPNADGHRPVAIHARTADAWVPHAHGLLAPAAPAAAPDWPQAWPPAAGDVIDAQQVYLTLGSLGFGYGPAFQGVRAAWSRGEEVWRSIPALPRTPPASGCTPRCWTPYSTRLSASSLRAGPTAGCRSRSLSAVSSRPGPA